MAEPVQLEEDGLLTIRIGDAEATFDLYDVNDRLVEAHNRLREAPPADYFGAIKEVMESVQLPVGTNRLASRFQKAVWDAVDDLKKKDGASPPQDLPASTGPVL